MSRKFLPSHLDHAKRLLAQGMTLKKMEKIVGFGPDCLSRKLREAGVAIPQIHAAWNKLAPDPAPLVAAYTGGESELAISLRTGLGRNVIRRVLVEQGIAIRTGSEANLIRMQRLSPDARKALTKASHAAVAKQPREWWQKLHAKCADRRCKRRGKGEAILEEALRRHGLPVEPQKPCGPYNLDFAVGTIAVEVVTTTPRHSANRHFAERVEYLAQHGYTVMAVQFPAKREDVLGRQLDDVVRLIEFAYRLPPLARKHRVIRCSLERFAIFRNERGQLASIPAPERFFYTVCDFDPRVSR